MNVQVLPRPVMGRDLYCGDPFIGQQGGEMFPCRAACGKDGRGASAKMHDGARHVNAAAAGFKNRRGAA